MQTKCLAPSKNSVNVNYNQEDKENLIVIGQIGSCYNRESPGAGEPKQDNVEPRLG